MPSILLQDQSDGGGGGAQHSAAAAAGGLGGVQEMACELGSQPEFFKIKEVIKA